MQGGATAMLGLPLLEAMLDNHGEALAQGQPLPKHFVTWFFGNGVNLNKFEPDMPGSSGYTLSPLLAPLSDVKDYLTVCTGLANRCRPSHTHHEGLTAFSGYDFVDRPDLPGFASEFGGPTIDQLIADRIQAGSDAPPIHSMQVQISKTFSPADTGPTAQNLSAHGEPGAVRAKPGSTNPAHVWAALFGTPPAAGVRSSMLNFIRSDLAQLYTRLGVADRRRMDAHLQSINELEARTACDGGPAVNDGNQEPNSQERVTEVNSLMAEIMATAFECDLTRVASVIFIPMAGEVTLGVDLPNTILRTHHMWSHNANVFPAQVVDGLTGYEQNVRYIMDRFGDWLRAFKNRVEPNGTTNLLDSTILYASSDCAYGPNHKITRQPVLLGGHARGHLKFPAIHYQAAAGSSGTLNDYMAPSAKNTSDVLLTCLRAFDPGATSVGDLGGFGTPPGSSTPLCDIESGQVPC
jgi:hypothetical protein